MGNLIEENKNNGIDPSRHYGIQNGLAYTYVCVHLRVREESAMTTIKVGVREFWGRIASFLESDSPVAVTRRGETLGKCR